MLRCVAFANKARLFAKLNNVLARLVGYLVLYCKPDEVFSELNIVMTVILARPPSLLMMAPRTNNNDCFGFS